MPLPLALPLIGAGTSVLGSIFGAASSSKQRREALAAQKERDRRNRVAQGKAIYDEDKAMDESYINNDPVSLYESGGLAMIDPLTGIANSAVGMFGTMTNNAINSQYSQYMSNAPILNPDTSRFSRSAERDKLLNVTEEFAYGGKGVKGNSSDTAVIQAGTHESGDDLGFIRPDGTRAKVEGDEGIRDVGDDVQIFSNRLALPGDTESIAAKFSNLSSLKGNLEKTKMTSGDAVVNNTADRKILGVDKSLDNLFASQEAIKTLEGKQSGNEFAYGGTGIEDPLKLRLSDPTADADILGTDGRQAFEDSSIRFDNTGSSETSLKGDTIVNDEGMPKTSNVNAKTVNYAATGLTLLDNIYNAANMETPQVADPRYVSNVSLDTEIDVTAQENAVKTQLGNFYKNVDKNTSSSIVGLNMKLAATGDSIKNLNQVYDNKERLETQLANQEALANVDIDRTNIGIYNRNKDLQSHFDQRSSSERSANFANAIDDVTKGLLRDVDISRASERFAASEMNFADTGVILKNFDQGNYNHLTNDQVMSLLDKGRDAGNISKHDYDKRVSQLKSRGRK